jgi:hypothetical protein
MVFAAELLDVAASLTTGQLRHALRTLVHLLDPAAVRRRMAAARNDTRVEAFQEGSGNLALAGRELDPADAVAADRRITAIARALHAAGTPGSLDQLRAAVFTALLAGRDPDTLLPGHGTAQPGTAQPGTAGPGSPHGQASQPAPGTAGPGLAGPGTADGASGPVPGPGTGAAPGAAGTSPAAGGGSLAGLAGSVHITLPASTWLGLADLPGEAAGLGPLDAWTSRDLAARLAAAGPRTRWCITLTRPDGTAAAHACARAGPGPPAGPAARRRWLTRHPFTWLEDPDCSHHSQAPGYRPPRHLGDLIRARNQTCAFPGCRRPATSCDLDHTIAWDQGGRTCPCNLAPLCRTHHQAKQTPGWHLTQPRPGTLTWTTPHGRSYTVTPSTYIC